MVKGVTEGYSKSLEIVGVGYKVEAKGEAALFNLGYSHPIFLCLLQELNLKFLFLHK